MTSQPFTPSLRISAQGRIYLDHKGTPPDDLKTATWRSFVMAFQSSSEDGLIDLATSGLDEHLSPVFSYWREFSRRFLTVACQSVQGPGQHDPVSQLSQNELESLLDCAPLMPGAEYLNTAVLEKIWANLDEHVRNLVNSGTEGLREYLARKNPSWGQVGRLAFHLAENKNDETHPFAFLATYVSRISRQGTAQHQPLGKALQEYAGAQNRKALSALLAPVEKVAEASGFVRDLVDSGAIFRPSLWTAKQAYKFLQDLPKLESAGVMIRLPNWWKSGRAAKAQVSVAVGSKTPSHLGFGAILDFDVGITIDGVRLAHDDWKQLLDSADGLVRVKGQWVEVDHEKLKDVLSHWQKIQGEMLGGGIAFHQALRLVSGMTSGLDATASLANKAKDIEKWSLIESGPWLEKTMAQLRDPAALDLSTLKTELKATLRPYQVTGASWLYFATTMRLGACLADDMGLGKTIQVIALLLRRRQDQTSASSKPSLLVMPASLLGNWKSEITRFAPSLTFFVAHASEFSAMPKPGTTGLQLIGRSDVVMTTYGNVMRHDWLQDVSWDIVVLDEAQAIKNPNAKQTKAVKNLQSTTRIALTGTPVENRLSDLWSLFDFLNPGLLGSGKAFSTFTKRLASGDHTSFAPLKRLVKPYILRRMKTDKSVISDLPDKTEVLAHCSLAKEQAALYQIAVNDLAEKLSNKEGIARRGLILSSLMRFKQICNHPAHWLGDGNFDEHLSGKFLRLRELCEEIASRQERALVFTQFREMTEPLANYLADLFGRPGLVLSGDTSVKKRQELVSQFQSDDGPPFFVLSLKAGGTGLNLTAASHVIHFDRWWNPAVENQATDRAFRIGQKRNVMVHKFVCRGTIEEKIDLMIQDKKMLSHDVLGGDADGSAALLTSMSNQELMALVSLDLSQALGEM
jgi:superfamily II DNA or RNA helicase